MGFARFAVTGVFAGPVVCAVRGALAADGGAEVALKARRPPSTHRSAGPATRSIPFADHGGIFDWHADGTRGIWVQGANRNWFYGTFMSACTGLDRTDAVGFVTNPSGDLDHWSYVVIRGTVPCHFANFTTSEAPPGRG